MLPPPSRILCSPKTTPTTTCYDETRLITTKCTLEEAPNHRWWWQWKQLAHHGAYSWLGGLEHGLAKSHWRQSQGIPGLASNDLINVGAFCRWLLPMLLVCFHPHTPRVDRAHCVSLCVVLSYNQNLSLPYVRKLTLSTTTAGFLLRKCCFLLLRAVEWSDM